jgi:hypothetical protein
MDTANGDLSATQAAWRIRVLAPGAGYDDAVPGDFDAAWNPATRRVYLLCRLGRLAHARGARNRIFLKREVVEAYAATLNAKTSAKARRAAAMRAANVG